MHLFFLSKDSFLIPFPSVAPFFSFALQQNAQTKLSVLYVFNFSPRIFTCTDSIRFCLHHSTDCVFITSSNNIHSFIHNVDYWGSALYRYDHSFLLEALYSFLSENILQSSFLFHLWGGGGPSQPLFLLLSLQLQTLKM